MKLSFAKMSILSAALVAGAYSSAVFAISGPAVPPTVYHNLGQNNAPLRSGGIIHNSPANGTRAFSNGNGSVANVPYRHRPAVTVIVGVPYRNGNGSEGNVGVPYRNGNWSEGNGWHRHRSSVTVIERTPQGGSEWSNTTTTTWSQNPSNRDGSNRNWREQGVQQRMDGEILANHGVL